ncbi:DUF4136 domain-containing protein [Psychromonas sp. PT13]|uniref:DUF4136 domain-containing protein n=1 Tax=Psychromonas sp. PT13 TaxID=3439547 RepID=UPI003EBEC6FC
MKNIAVITCLLTSLFVLSACSSTSEKEQEVSKVEKKEQRMLVVTSAEPSKVLPAFTTFAWNDDYSEVLSPDTSTQQIEVQNYIRQELIDYLETKGYQYQPVGVQADVVIGFLYALKDTPATQSLQSRFGLLPSNKAVLKPSYPQGTLLLNVLDSPLEKVYWRSALLGFKDLQEQAHLNRKGRMQILLHSMLGRFPKAGR